MFDRQTTIVLDGLRAYGSPTVMPDTPFSHDDVHKIFRHEVDNPRRHEDADAHVLEGEDADE